ncbi:PTS sugar transporter subunit IIA [Granulosicoccus sp. 3-233]|uniref:PTS sugar transporter subunit IIA n=1 Tax=Granulosicoccus sp. 3-233 TaxID=3417969 RepID=UPI003D34A9B3
MDLSDLLDPERIRCHCSIQSKKRTLQTLAELLGESLRARNATDDVNDDDAEGGEEKSSPRKVRKSRKQSDKAAESADTLSDMQILDALISRERLGSTGLGHGVGLPHSRLASIEEPIAAFVTLEKGVDYESVDGQPVDLVFGLLVPEHCNDEHLQILAQMARRFSDAELRDTLRGFDDPDALYEHLTSLQPVST